jgi:isopentenyl diphosphate isomerase/L-lactate dehydrogenase-like FMN-dependent dehydrogenase
LQSSGDVAKAFGGGADFVMLAECLLVTMKVVVN